jgi:type I restriction enzyme S subunit
MKTGWKSNTLGNTCDMYQPKTISGKEMLDDGAYPVFGANGIIGRYDKYNHEETQLLITCRGATCGSVNISSPKSWITANAMVVRPKTKEIDLTFLEYLFRGGIDISKAITGTAQPQITQTNLSKIQIFYPESISEQHRIVAILDQAFDGIATAKANAEQNLKNARALFESHLQSVFTERGEGWVEKRLSELCDIKHGYAFGGTDFSSSVPASYPLVITPGNFTEDGKLLFNERNSKRFKGKLPAGFCFDVGDLVIVMTDLSSKMKILGKPAFVEIDNILHNQRIGRIILSSNCIEKRLLYYFMMTDDFLKKIKMSATGTLIKHTAPSRILNNLIYFSENILEQQKIISNLDELHNETQHLESIYQRKLAALDDLKKSLLNQAFSGDL